ncbi:hypothetical protein FRC08_000522 [Ceratobasidium sp. 394]|nr:hypothetical protein FRC08_000522 [Ceratobasidium sp. 394]KAG9090651.1 hypothetical protein FS749_000391 [Ceratobasidium sp. UAMH 11750]
MSTRPGVSRLSQSTRVFDSLSATVVTIKLEDDALNTRYNSKHGPTPVPFYGAPAYLPSLLLVSTLRF